MIPLVGVGSLTGRFGYTGQMFLPELDLYYYRARIYNPALGRFLQTDPVGYEDQMNLYAYVWNDPVNKIDPTGKSALAAEGVILVGGMFCARSPACVKAVGSAVAAGIAWGASHLNETAESPHINPGEISGKTPEQIEQIADEKGLISKGPDHKGGRGSYVDPVTGKQRILVHPDADCGPHCHVNDPEGNRLDEKVML